MKSLHILSGGAAQGLVSQLQPIFQAQNNCRIEGSFGAVGLMRDKLLAGEPCDVLILTQALIEQLTSNGQVRAGSARPLGRVRTGVAVKSGEVLPQVDDPAALRQALKAAKGIYFPDPLQATAGIHFMNVLQQLGLDKELAARLHVFPNGATAMREMAQAGGTGLIGCTQITEILYTPGVQLVAPLPREFELSTVYVAAVCKRAQLPQEAAALVELLASEQATQLRRAGGFE
jgi:molybdate transport system substrate-binding protein